MNTLQAVFTLDFFQKGIWGGRVEWPKQKQSQGGRAKKLWDCDPTEPKSQFYIIPNRRAAQRAQLLSVLALSYWFFDKSLRLLEAPTHFLHPDFFCLTDFPWKLPICLVLRVSPTEQWCANDLIVWCYSNLEFLHGYKHIAKRKKLWGMCLYRKAHLWGTICMQYVSAFTVTLAFLPPLLFVRQGVVLALQCCS